MKQKLLIGIDGTGPVSDQNYNKKMRGGFVSRMCNVIGNQHLAASAVIRGRNGFVTTMYARGPGATGLTSTAIKNAIMGSLRGASPAPLFMQPTHSNSSSPYSSAETRGTQLSSLRSQFAGGIYLVGFSRGGHIAVNIAKELDYFGVPVEAMFLFDSVDRDIAMSSWSIPGNVESVYHAIRSEAVNSRWYFGSSAKNTARVDQTRKLCSLPDERKFDGTHAAIGGFPWAGDHPRKSRIPKLSAAIEGGVMSVGLLSNWPTTGTRMLAKTANGMINPRTITEAGDRSASQKVYLWMLERTKRHGIQWQWQLPPARRNR